MLSSAFTDTALHQTLVLLEMDICMPSMDSFSCFVLQILKQFGKLSKDLEQIRRYPSFRTTEIKKGPDKAEDATPLPDNEGIGDNSAILDSENLGETPACRTVQLFFYTTITNHWRNTWSMFHLING